MVTLTLNPAVDKSSTVGQVVAEAKLRCDKPMFEPGGGGINVARAAQRLGGDALAVYTSGGQLGKMLEELLDEEKVRQRPFSISGLTRENLTVYERSSERQYRFGMPGPELSEDEAAGLLDEATKLMEGADYMVASGSLPRGVPDGFYANLAEVAGEKGCRLIVDTSGGPLERVSKKGAFMIKPNIRELKELCGKDVSDPTAVDELAESMLDTNEAVLVSLGSQGAHLVSREGNLRIPAPTVPIKSKVGAGDSMVAGTVTKLAQGWDLFEAVRFGVAAGAAAVMTPGSELCRKEDAERLYEQLK